VIKELRGEKIDIVKWSEDPATYVVNALGSAQVSKVVIDEEQGKVEVVVADEDQSQAIGRRGQNVKLISELVGWKINIITAESEVTKRQEEFIKTTALFMENLNLEEILAQLLASEGFHSIKSLADANPTAIANIEGLDEEVAGELISRAQEHIKEKKVDKVNDSNISNL
jgi:N utilization substance protein A